MELELIIAAQNCYRAKWELTKSIKQAESAVMTLIRAQGISFSKSDLADMWRHVRFS
jgi:hypothetical protein